MARAFKIVAGLAFVLLTSCKTSINQSSYFQDLNSDNKAIALNTQQAVPEIKICPDDQLAILVTNIDSLAVAPFNMPANNQKMYYVVDNKGNIEFPVLGKLNVAGMTRTELIDMLTEKISKYVKDPIVNIQLKNFQIAVLGEVKKPGYMPVTNERITVLDALAMANDMTIYGNRKNVTVIRDTNGKKEYHTFDLTSSECFSSPFFYLKQNDVVYVEPNQYRRNSSRYSETAQYHISVASTFVSGFSVIASLLIALLLKK